MCHSNISSSSDHNICDCQVHLSAHSTPLSLRSTVTMLTCDNFYCLKPVRQLHLQIYCRMNCIRSMPMTGFPHVKLFHVAESNQESFFGAPKKYILTVTNVYFHTQCRCGYNTPQFAFRIFLVQIQFCPY